MDGVSMLYAFNDGTAANKKERQYYEMFGNRAIWADGWKAVTLHANRMPWMLMSYYHSKTTFGNFTMLQRTSQKALTLAEKHPEKLEELINIFEEEAWKYNVYPLYDDMIQRIGKQQDRLFGDKKEFVYFAPGAIRIAEKSSAPVKNRAHTIETQIDLRGDEEGVIAAVGGMTGGYSMFIKAIASITITISLTGSTTFLNHRHYQKADRSEVQFH